ncbi:MAG: YbaB/EbfC family nucleoid-associated protein [Arsenophonus sp.]|nr:MAG: YbaB/EbfC family nucleoid-associated protein [Arsenophonus sp.]
MFNKNTLSSFIERAQEMQEKIKKTQEEMSKIKVTGESGAGLVKITINGTHYCQKINIDPSLLLDEKEILEDLIVAAFNDAVRRIDQIQKEKMKNISTNIPFIPGLKIPF